MANEPIITASVRDVNNTTTHLTGDNSVLIRYFSTARAYMSVEAQGGAAINEDMYIIRNGSETAYWYTNDFVNVSSDEFTFSAEDSERRVARETVYADMIDYVKLTCYISGSKIDTSGSVRLICDGDYFNGDFGAQNNTITVQCRYRLRGGTWSGYYTMTVSKYGNYYSAYRDLAGLDYTQSYDFECYASDALMAVSDRTYNVKSKPVFHWSERDVAFEVPVTVADDFEVGGEARIKGNLRLKGDTNYGNTLYFGDSNYCRIGESPDDEMFIAAKTLDLDVGEFMINGDPVALPESGEWTPTLTLGVVDYYTRNGWYTKAGDVVTVGFYLKASCGAGYENYLITIEGLPYTPRYMASGGGICSGVYISTAKNFLCFVAETNGEITLRAQACDDTRDDVLDTSASACRYPDGTFTLSGTISYMV